MFRVRTLLPCLLLWGCDAPPDPPAPASLPAVPGAESWCQYIDKSGTVVIGPELDVRDGFDFQEGLAGVKNGQGRLGYIDANGRVVIPFEFEDGTSHREGYAGVLKDGMCGYIDLEGELVVALEYDSVTSFRDGWGAVRRNGRFTFVNAEGREIGETFAAAESFSEGLAAVAPLPAESGGEGGRRFGFIDVNGEEVIAPRYEDAEPFSEGLAAVKLEDKWGYIDATGRMIVPPRFDLAGPFHEGLAPVSIGPAMGYIDASGSMVIEPRFEADRFRSDEDEKPVFVGRFVEGLAAVRYARGPEELAGWGFVDREGRFVTPPAYEDAYMFSEGLARVKTDGKWGYIDTSGRQVIPPSYRKAGEFAEGLALVCGE